MNFKVSKDANTVKLAQKHQVDVIISSNTLRSLAGSVGPLFRYSWDIPFTVSEMNVKGNHFFHKFPKIACHSF